jgi:hypothetical protein
MAQITLRGPMYDSQELNTGVSTERGDSPKKIVENINTMMAELYAADEAAETALAGQSTIQFIDVTVTSAELLAIFTTPVPIVAAPGANLALVLESVVAHKPAGTAYDGIAAGEDLSISYTDASGLAVAGIETTGFLDQATAQTRHAGAYRAASGISSVTPAANAALVLHGLVGNIATGDSDLLLRIYYRVIPTVLV